MKKLNSAINELVNVYEVHAADTMNFGGDKSDHMRIAVPYWVVKTLAKHYKRKDRNEKEDARS